MSKFLKLVRPSFALTTAFLLFAPLGVCQQAHITFPRVGKVTVHPVRVAGSVPSVKILNRSGNLLLHVTPATGNFWKVSGPGDLFGPHIWSADVHLHGLPTPLLLVDSDYVYAGGRENALALVGEEHGKLAVLTPALPKISGNSKAYLASGNAQHAATLTLIAERFGPGDTILNGTSRVTVSRYVFHSSTGRFVFKGKQVMPKNAVKVKGRNLLALMPKAGRNHAG